MKAKKHQLNGLQKDRVTDRISSCLKGEGKAIVAAYLFGSFVTDAVFSDLDIGLIMVEAVDQPLKYEMALEGKLERITGFPADVRVLNRTPLAFCQNVIRQGKLVLDAEPNLRAAFEGRVLKEYFDFRRFRRRYLNEVVNAPV
jgi:predicted nucleotidyltransferase